MNDIIQDLYYQCDTALSLEQFRAEINKWHEQKIARLREVEACAKEMYDDYLHNRTILDTDWDLLGEALAEGGENG